MAEKSYIVCLDISVLIDYYRKKDKSKSLFFKLTKDHSLFAVSAITEYEIYSGSNPEQDKFWNEFFKLILVLPFDSETNKIAVKIARELKAKSKSIEIPDLFIASTALKNNLKLATLNQKHFERVTGLALLTE
jgi:predicted nucleic acid-binding protein